MFDKIIKVWILLLITAALILGVYFANKISNQKSEIQAKLEAIQKRETDHINNLKSMTDRQKLDYLRRRHK